MIIFEIVVRPLLEKHSIWGEKERNEDSGTLVVSRPAPERSKATLF